MLTVLRKLIPTNANPPDPDPEISWTERKRLFEMQGSTWNDYSDNLISSGGGVYERNAKSIKLSPEVKVLLGTNE